MYNIIHYHVKYNIIQVSAISLLVVEQWRGEEKGRAGPNLFGFYHHTFSCRDKIKTVYN